MLTLLRSNALLLLFLVAATGYALGSIRVKGVGLGVAAVLFAGLGFGALDPGLKLPEFAQTFGLALFAYTVGLSSGPGFVAALRRRGLRDNSLAAGVLLSGAAMAWGAARLLGLSAAQTAGLFAGALTNTPALAAAIEYLKAHSPPALHEGLLTQPVVAYSLVYPLAVIAPIVGISLARRSWPEAAATASTRKELTSLTLRLTEASFAGKTARQVRHELARPFLFGRLRRGQRVELILDETPLELHDVLSVVGTEDALREVVARLGKPVDERLDLDRRVLDYRRVFVSNPEVVGRRLEELHLPQRFGAIISRLRRGDVDLLPTGDTVLELGDRARVVAPRAQLAAVARHMGDSYKALSEVDVISFSVGIALGLLLGALPVPLPGGGEFRLGSAGGPLVVGLTLGALGRTGSLVWQPPYSAGLTLRQLGVVLFLAGVGTRSGGALADTLRSGGGLALAAAGAVVSILACVAMLWGARRLLGASLPFASGLLAGVLTQPAVLAFAAERSDGDEANVGYATVYPAAMIIKILLAQLFVMFS